MIFFVGIFPAKTTPTAPPSNPDCEDIHGGCDGLASNCDNADLPGVAAYVQSVCKKTCGKC